MNKNIIRRDFFAYSFATVALIGGELYETSMEPFT
jgi:hypothetical protein